MEPFDPVGLPDPALLALIELGNVTDPQLLLDELVAADEAPDDGTREGVAIPGESESLEIRLTDEQKTELALELCEICDEYKRAASELHSTEDQIRDAYAQKFDPALGGTVPDAAEMASEMVMSFTDQAAARLQTNVMGVTPLMVVDVTEGVNGLDPTEADELRRATERFINSYTMEELDFEHLLPVALLRTCKVGTSVFYLGWKEERRVHYEYEKTSPKAKRVEKRVGVVDRKLIDNKSVIVWPPTLINWQEGYQIVGHEMPLTPAEWREIVARYKLSKEVTESIELDPGEPTKTGESERQVSSTELADRKSLQPVMLTELWCHMILPGRTEPDKFQAILHRPSYRILWIGYNGYHSQKHPYHPVRYKWSDNSAWGTGIGQEIINNWAADTALWCLELDNLYAGAYWVILRRSGSMYHTQTDNIRPGMNVPVEDVEKDFKPVKMGGDAPEVGMARTQNQSRAASASGLSSVMFGQGDPVMKSGAGTGSTLGLIEQGNKKIAAIFSNIKVDVSAAYMRVMELVAQFAPGGVFYRHVDEQAATRLKQLEYVPPRGDISRLFRFRAQAPSTSSTDEARRQGYMMIWTFAMQHAEVISQYVLQTLQTENPAAIPRWNETVTTYLNQIARKVIEYQEMPGVEEFIPYPPQLTQQDEIINQQTQQLQQLQGQLQQAQMTLQQLAQQGAGMMGGGQPGMMPGGPPMGPGMGQPMPTDAGMMPAPPAPPMPDFSGGWPTQ